jgi:glutamine synthetase
MKKRMPLSVRYGLSTRADFPLIISKTAFLVIDIQDHLSSSKNSVEDDKDRGSSVYLFDQALPNVVENIAKLLNCARKFRDEAKVGELPGCEVVITFLQAHTTDCRDISLDYKLSGPKLAKLPNPTNLASFDTLPKALQPSIAGRGDIILPKTSCSVFQSTNLRYILSNVGIQQLVVCGQLTDQCVMSAVRDAADLGYFVTVVEDGCTALSKEEHDRGILGMKGFARILSTRQVLHELQSARADEDEHEGQTKMKPRQAVKDDITEDEKYESTIHGHLLEASLWKPRKESQDQGAIEALLHTLQFANVDFLRFSFVDVANSIRAKAVPIKRLVSSPRGESGTILDDQVSIPKVCVAGLPSYKDVMIAETKIDAKDVLMIRPDLSSLRILPYATRSAMVFGTLHDQRTGELSNLCPRGLLARVIETADEKLGIGFTVGTEIEFCLVKAAEGAKIVAPDTSLYAGTTTLNDQEEFISDLYNCLEKQKIDVELIHAESASGQMEIVLPYDYDVMKLADNIVLARETIKACAKKHDMRALFLPKVYENQAGNGMHIHMSLRNKRSIDPYSNIFPGTTPFSISNSGQSFIEGILTNLEGLISMTLSTPNSFSRVGKGCWTGHSIGWEVEEKESPLRVCLDSRSSKATNVELKLVDNSCNVYLALASVLWAGFDGISKAMTLRPMLSQETEGQQLPTNLETSLGHLVESKLFQNLLGETLLTSYVAVKRAEIKHYESTSPKQIEDCVLRELTK